MSYDLLVFDSQAAPREQQAFLDWYSTQVDWSETYDYNDPAGTTPELRSWFDEMIQSWPPMNGPLATDDVDDPHMSDYSIGPHVIYIAFAWSCADEAYLVTRQLAEKHQVGFFGVSSQGEIIFPDGQTLSTAADKPWWKFW